jgi:hypothetical protein
MGFPLEFFRPKHGHEEVEEEGEDDASDEQSVHGGA